MKASSQKKISTLVSRVSISLPPPLLNELDSMVESRGYESRSQAIGEMVNYQLSEHKRTLGNEVMVGTITLLYDRLTRDLQKKLADMQYKHINEVISSLHVHLTEDQMMEVILVQGPAAELQAVANEMITLRGIITGRLQLLAAVIPPVHPLSANENRVSSPRNARKAKG
ncbi:nickel-responsive transcriptional regulator NikR [Sideroxydans lithotrophicus]|uniref:Putative nickel-responsive regulator n=1 Tax=Sideroxydans lithotrophicus (strain ES-1) TaxID=580332 RepID=D5CTN1_SIDLE|nr:nickel-responsive transcriptional regulator NikR [Sideroxydans lithotrophicus]ADE10337.1 transcriptional regulator NikR, CopG family [Sideroxydans lithotrophicus ES-1]